MKADLAYFDPPYATEFSTKNYEKFYHFVEGLMTYWDGLTIKADSKVKCYEISHVTVTRRNASDFIKEFLGKAAHIPHWLISYRDHACPNEQQMKKIIGGLGRQSRMETKDHKYSKTFKHGEACRAKERLFVCLKGNQSRAELEKRKNVMKKDKNKKYRGQEELLLFPMEKNKTKASEKQPETHYFTWESFAATIPILEKQVRHKTFTCVYGNSRGGLLLAVLLSHRLGLPLVTTPYASMLWCEDIVDDSETYLRSKRLFPGAVYCAIVTRKYAKDIIHAFDYTKKTALVKFPWEDV